VMGTLERTGAAVALPTQTTIVTQDKWVDPEKAAAAERAIENSRDPGVPGPNHPDLARIVASRGPRRPTSLDSDVPSCPSTRWLGLLPRRSPPCSYREVPRKSCREQGRKSSSSTPSVGCGKTVCYCNVSKTNRLRESSEDGQAFATSEASFPVLPTMSPG